MESRVLTVLFLLTGIIYWLPLTAIKPGKKLIPYCISGVLCLIAGITAALAFGFTAGVLIALYTAVIWIAGGGIYAALKQMISPAAVPLYLLGGLALFTGTIWYNPTLSSVPTITVLRFSPPVILAGICNVNLFRGILYGIVPLSMQYTVIPAWWQSALIFACAGIAGIITAECIKRGRSNLNAAAEEI